MVWVAVLLAGVGCVGVLWPPSHPQRRLWAFAPGSLAVAGSLLLLHEAGTVLPIALLLFALLCALALGGIIQLSGTHRS
ncbi:MAG: hypothetical protein IMW91_04600 [Firmicutes bacterium]|nr:hypothetical protein [Bacillota bacterium]